ncbi:MAG: T9SS type A sorting domain-containing protein [Bacteroidales bacterium]|nr:T9SS type A sorting domain-containing protein [Bacteroidales bacterium]
MIFIKSIILSVFIIHFSISNAQINEVFNISNDVNPENFDSGTKPYYWNDGILVLGFCYDAELIYEGLALSFYDTLGNVVWNKVYIIEEVGHLQGNDICFFDNSSFYVTGITLKDTINETDMFIAKFNAHGDSIYFKYFRNTMYTFPFQIFAYAQDTLLVFSAEKNHSDDVYVRNTFTRFDTFGNIISVQSTELSLETGKQILLGENYIYLGGNRRTSATDNFNVKAFVKVLDYDLNYIGYMVPPYILNSWFVGLNLINSKVYLTSLEEHSYYFYDQVRVTKFSDINTPGRDTSALVGPQDPYAVVYRAVSNGCTFIIQMDSLYFFDLDLNYICSKSLNTPLGEYSGLSDMCLTNSNKIIGTGKSQPEDIASTSNHWVFLTVPFTDFLCENCPTNIEFIYEADEVNFEVYPTIFNSEITVTDKNCSGRLSNIQIYNSLGICVYEGQFDCSTTIYCSEFECGTYVLSIYDGINNTTQKIIKIE